MSSDGAVGLGPRTSRPSLPRLTITLRLLSKVQGRLTLTEPKARAARRQIALPAPIAGLLGQHLAEHPATDGYGFGTPQEATCCSAPVCAGVSGLLQSKPPWANPAASPTPRS